MKPRTLLILTIILPFILASCSSIRGIGDASKTGPNEATLITNLDKIVEGWNSRETVEYFEKYISDDFVRISHGKPHFKGINSFVELMQGFSSSFPDQKVLLKDKTVRGNRVFTHWTVNGTHNGEFLGYAPSGINIDIHGYSVWTFNDKGMLIREEAYWNDLETLDKLGISVEPASK